MVYHHSIDKVNEFSEVSIRYPTEREIFRKKFFHYLELTFLGSILYGESEFHISETWK
jgi:hypothetical protein